MIPLFDCIHFFSEHLQGLIRTVENLKNMMRQNLEILQASVGNSGESLPPAPPNWPRKFPLASLAELLAFDNNLSNHFFFEYAVSKFFFLFYFNFLSSISMTVLFFFFSEEIFFVYSGEQHRNSNTTIPFKANNASRYE